jgi:flagellin-like hook-associated protein FlgL
MAGTYGAAATIIEVRSEFTDSMIDLLDTGADALVAADVNEASASLLAVQTRQQIAATALAMATTSDNTALRLFGLE